MDRPPAVAKLAARGDPPPEIWPGRAIGSVDIARAAGDPRDWFGYAHRYEAAAVAWAEFNDARARRRNLLTGEWAEMGSWNQILIIGEYGSGKTSVAVAIARHFFGLGHPVFANASTLFGWRLGQNELYTSMGRVPKGSVLIVDESSAALASRLGGSTALGTWSEMSLNIRKQACLTIFMSAQDWAISSSVRRDCREVWMPVAKEHIVFDGEDPARRDDAHLQPMNDPHNFILAYHVWEDFPYKRANLIEGKVEEDGFGAPSYTAIIRAPNEVRRAFLLNDTFELAQVGAASTADADAIKASVRDWRADQFGEAGGTSGVRNLPEVTALFAYVADLEVADELPEHIQPSVLANAMGLPVQKAGSIVKEWFPGVENVQRKGYPSEFLLRYWRNHLEPRLFDGDDG